MRKNIRTSASSSNRTSEELNCLRCGQPFPRTVDIYGETEMLCNTCKNTAASEFIGLSSGEFSSTNAVIESSVSQRDDVPTREANRQVQWRLVEQRRNQRKKHSIPARLDFLSLSGNCLRLDGHLKDISASGAALVFPSELPGKAAHRSKIRLTLTRADRIVRWSGYLARLSRGENNSSIIGIAFYKPQPEIMATLESHVSLTIELAESPKSPKTFPRVPSPGDFKLEKVKRGPGAGASGPSES